jgi:hypothetical protein
MEATGCIEGDKNLHWRGRGGTREGGAGKKGAKKNKGNTDSHRGRIRNDLRGLVR